MASGFKYYKLADEQGAKARKISRSQLRAYTMGLLKTQQAGLCAICKKPVDLKQMGVNSAYVLDHCHDTGLVRGVLHRGCNGALGKMENAIGRWAGLGMNYDAIIEWLEGAVDYYKSGFQPVIYPDHKTPAEREEAARLKRNKEAALKRARERVRKEIEKGK